MGFHKTREKERERERENRMVNLTPFANLSD